MVNRRCSATTSPHTGARFLSKKRAPVSPHEGFWSAKTPDLPVPSLNGWDRLVVHNERSGREHIMKNNDNQRLLDHKRQVDAERKAQAVLRKREQQRRNLAAIARVAGRAS